MGVKELWAILSPVKRPILLKDLEGQILAVDLSIWICETQGVKQMHGHVVKPHLRNLFFRVSHLSQLGIKLVFVVEGEPPELKWETMLKRTEARFGNTRGRGRGRGSQRGAPKKPGRSHFKTWIKECCAMLDYLGIPYVQSVGEAEAMCAVLNKEGIVDACLTDDGDAFLYGACKVYKNFTMSGKDPHIEMYSTADIETQLGLDREALVGLGLLLGCDFVPKGVPGVGKEMASKLMKMLQGVRVLERFRDWKTQVPSGGSHVELNVWKKSKACPNFPFEKVINEFMVQKDTIPKKDFKWKRPKMFFFQKLAFDKMEWPEDYSQEKILPLMSLYDLKDIQLSRHHDKKKHLTPFRIVKARVRQGVPCYEIDWHKEDADATTEKEYYTTLEERNIFKDCFPNLVQEFEDYGESRKKGKSKDKSTKTKAVANAVPDVKDIEADTEEITGVLNDLSITESNTVQNLKPTKSDYIEISDDDERDIWKSSDTFKNGGVNCEQQKLCVKKVQPCSSMERKGEMKRKDEERQLGQKVVCEKKMDDFSQSLKDMTLENHDHEQSPLLPLSQRLMMKTTHQSNTRGLPMLYKASKVSSVQEKVKYPKTNTFKDHDYELASSGESHSQGDKDACIYGEKITSDNNKSSCSNEKLEQNEVKRIPMSVCNKRDEPISRNTQLEIPKPCSRRSSLSDSDSDISLFEISNSGLEVESYSRQKEQSYEISVEKEKDIDGNQYLKDNSNHSVPQISFTLVTSDVDCSKKESFSKASRTDEYSQGTVTPVKADILESRMNSVTESPDLFNYTEVNTPVMPSMIETTNLLHKTVVIFSMKKQHRYVTPNRHTNTYQNSPNFDLEFCLDESENSPFRDQSKEPENSPFRDQSKENNLPLGQNIFTNKLKHMTSPLLPLCTKTVQPSQCREINKSGLDTTQNWNESQIGNFSMGVSAILNSNSFNDSNSIFCSPLARAEGISRNAGILTGSSSSVHQWTPHERETTNSPGYNFAADKPDRCITKQSHSIIEHDAIDLLDESGLDEDSINDFGSVADSKKSVLSKIDLNSDILNSPISLADRLKQKFKGLKKESKVLQHLSQSN